jgi:hypothetical protein
VVAAAGGSRSLALVRTRHGHPPYSETDQTNHPEGEHVKTGTKLVPRIVIAGMAMVVAAAMIAAAPPAHAADTAPITTPADHSVDHAAGTDSSLVAGTPIEVAQRDAVAQLCAESPHGVTTCVPVYRDGSIGDGLPTEVLASENSKSADRSGQEIVKPDVQVGVGWYIYLYLSRSEVSYLISLGYAGATSALCSWLAPTVLGAVVCGAAAAAVWYYIQNWNPVPSGHCLELRWIVTLTPAIPVGAKFVRRSC